MNKERIPVIAFFLIYIKKYPGLSASSSGALRHYVGVSPQ